MQFLESVSTLHANVTAITAAQDQLLSRRLQHAELIASYSDQVPIFCSPLYTHHFYCMPVTHRVLLRQCSFNDSVLSYILSLAAHQMSCSMHTADANCPTTIPFLIKSVYSLCSSVSVLAQVAELQLRAADAASPEAEARLQQLHASWADRDNTAGALAVDDQAIADHVHTAIANAWSLLITPASAGLAEAHITDPLGRLRAATSHMAKSLYDIATAAEHLPGQHSTVSSSRSADHCWKATVFAVSTTHMVANKVLQQLPSSPSASASGTSPSLSPLDSVVQCLDQALYEQLLTPCVTAQLQAAAEQLSTTDKQQEPLDLQSDSQILEDLSHLELEPALQQGQHTHFNHAQSQVQLPELTPFMDFDTSLPGADKSLESGLESRSQQQTNAAEAPDNLVAFTDFDPSLGGADELLELDMASQDSTPHADHPSSPTPAAATSVTDQHGHELSGSAGHSTCMEPQEGDNRALSQAMQHFIECAGRMAVAQQVQESMSRVSSKLQQLMTTQQHEQEIVRFEWMHEPALQQALDLPEGLGPPAVISVTVSYQLRPYNILASFAGLFCRPVHTCDGFQRTIHVCKARKLSKAACLLLYRHLVARGLTSAATSTRLWTNHTHCTRAHVVPVWLSEADKAVMQTAELALPVYAWCLLEVQYICSHHATQYVVFRTWAYLPSRCSRFATLQCTMVPDGSVQQTMPNAGTVDCTSSTVRQQTKSQSRSLCRTQSYAGFSERFLMRTVNGARKWLCLLLDHCSVASATRSVHTESYAEPPVLSRDCSV